MGGGFGFEIVVVTEGGAVAALGCGWGSVGARKVDGGRAGDVGRRVRRGGD